MWICLAVAGAALGVADDPAHGVAGGNRTGADELLAGLQGDVGDLTGRGVDLIERAGREWIDLHGVDEAVAHRLHPRGGIGLRDALLRILRLWRRLAAGHGLQLTRQRQWLRQLDDLHRRRRIGRQHRRHELVIGDVRRNELLCAAAERGGTDQEPESRMCGKDAQSRRPGFAERRLHCPSSFDQLMALT